MTRNDQDEINTLGKKIYNLIRKNRPCNEPNITIVIFALVKCLSTTINNLESMEKRVLYLGTVIAALAKEIEEDDQ